MPTRATPSSPCRLSSDLWRLALVFSLLFFVGLGIRPLGNPDEGRYAEIPREMAASGDYVTPRLNGVKYFEKPPLLYWLTALTMEVGGVNEVTARFWPALFGVLGALATYAAARALYDRLTGIAASVVLATSLFYYGLSGIALLDGAVSVLIATALFAFIVGVLEPVGTKRRWLFWGFYAAMALASLSKGLIGLALPCAVVGLWVLLLNRWRQLWPFYPFSGTLIVLLIAAPWHILAARANSDFLYFYFVHEHWLRFTTQIHDRYAPWWYFIPVLFGGLFPWVVFLFQALRRGLAGGWSLRIQNQVAWFLVIWTGFIFLFFSKSQSKLAPYILPVFPALAVLIGHYLVSTWRDAARPRLRLGLVIYAVLALAIGLALPWIRIVRDPAMQADLRPWVLLVAVLFALSGLVVGLLTARRRTGAALIAVAVGTAVALVALNPAASRADKRSTYPLALALKSQLQPGDTVYCYKHYFQDLPVYLGQLVSVVDDEGEMGFGVQAEPERAAGRFIDEAEFVRRWTLPPRCFALARKKEAAAFLARTDLPHVVLAEYRDQILFSNRRP